MGAGDIGRVYDHALYSELLKVALNPESEFPAFVGAQVMGTGIVARQVMM